MTQAVDSAVWHRLIGGLIEALDKPNFWNILIRYLGDVLHFDNWVVLQFSRDHRPVVFAESPSASGGADELFQDYLNGFYLLDPFYIACLDDPRAGLLRLDDVAPDRFEAEDYYQRYFKLNIVMDEVQFNLPLGRAGVLILSLGSQRRYSVEDMTLLNAITPWMLALIRQRSALHEWQDDDSTAEPGSDGVDAPTALAKGSSNLTNRELEIVQLLLSGFSSKGIAQKLKISPETVKGHRKHIYTKLGVKSHAELFAIYLQAKQAAR
ncbi:MAG: helix-turn-helix transcriptional regulator [Burkholderiaceae bacterium]|nr:helix-turn-helix transcriptional regulator [Burkholderiaceae bacterium]MBT9502913.1 helix-turn-helix transcriptional regulator [Burkholderiaceae bacterium]